MTIQLNEKDKFEVFGYGMSHEGLYDVTKYELMTIVLDAIPHLSPDMQNEIRLELEGLRVEEMEEPEDQGDQND
jgi:hypothetical protein